MIDFINFKTTNIFNKKMKSFFTTILALTATSVTALT